MDALVQSMLVDPASSSAVVTSVSTVDVDVPAGVPLVEARTVVDAPTPIDNVQFSPAPAGPIVVGNVNSAASLAFSGVAAAVAMLAIYMI